MLWRGSGAPQGVAFAVLGLAILCLLLVVPLWNAAVMLRNPVFLYFVGGSMPIFIILLCGCQVGLYFLVMTLVIGYGRKEARSDMNLLTISTAFISLLGASSLVSSIPLKQAAQNLKKRVLRNCEHGAKTRGLFDAYNELSTLREAPACAAQHSVEVCKGFQPTEATELLKAMEEKYLCSGWCAPPRPVGTGWARSYTAARASYVYPPTLFSKANYQATCDGTAARDLQFFLTDLSDELFYEGAYLISISVCVGFLKLISFCMTDTQNLIRKRDASYAATSYGGAAASSPPRYAH